MSPSDPTPGVRNAVLSVALAALVPAVAWGGLPQFDIGLFADGRAAATSGEATWLDEGLGKARYGGDVGDGGRRNGLEFADVSLTARTDWTWDLSSYVHVQYAPDQDKPVDLVEAWLGYRPVPGSALSLAFKAGLYFPHISREHVGPAWTTRYTITPSAANSWIGEEIRALGGQARLAYKRRTTRWSLTAGLFGYNDPAGTLLAYRGWALNGVKVGAFSRLPLAPLPSIGVPGAFLRFQVRWVHPIREVDGRLGFHASLDWEYAHTLKAGVFYYDNGGDPAAFKYQQYGWDTRFWNYYLEAAPRDGLTIISQYMTGLTLMGRPKPGNILPLDVDYRAAFVLVSQEVGLQWLSLRRDWFDATDNTFVVEDDNNEDGTAWTIAAGRKVGRRDSIVVELMHIESTRPARESIGAEAAQNQTLIQASFRKRF